MDRKRRFVVALLDHEHNLLRDLVETTMIPDGQFIRRWDWWCSIVRTFNELTERAFSPDDLHHYVQTLRKRGLDRSPRWEALGEGHTRMPGRVYLDLTPNQRTVLVEEYVLLSSQIGGAADAILLDSEHRHTLARRFVVRTGVALDDASLIASLIDLRKDGHLPRQVNSRTHKRRRPYFPDMDQASGSETTPPDVPKR